MKKDAIIASIVVLSLTLGCAYGQEETLQEFTTGLLKKNLGFDRFPGKKGPLKPGFKFKLEDYPQLEGLRVLSNEIKVTDRGEEDDDEGQSYRVKRKIELGRVNAQGRPERIEFEIEVNLDSTEGAQEGIVRDLSLSSFPLEVPGLFKQRLDRGDQRGLAVGDFNLISPFFKELSSDFADLGSIDFVRNNVRVAIDRSDSSVDLSLLAKAIDDRIRLQPDLTPEQLRATAVPVIASFGPRVEKITRGESTDVVLDVSDPHGEDLRVFLSPDLGKTSRVIGNRLVVEAPIGGRALRDEEPLSVVVVNQSGLFAKAKAVLKVEENDD